MFTKHTTLIATALALGITAIAAPAQAASSDGAVVIRTSDCQDNHEVCQTVTDVRNEVQTPSGIRSSSTFSNQVDTNLSDGTTTRRHSHELQNDGQLVELRDYQLQQTTQISPEGESCTDLEAFHRTSDNIQYLRETAICR